MGYFFFLAYSQSINVADGSVILKTDNGKYRDTDESLSEVESDDESEETERYIHKSTKINNGNYSLSIISTRHNLSIISDQPMSENLGKIIHQLLIDQWQ